MACNCQNCPNMIVASGITVSSGVTTITIPSGTTFNPGSSYCIGLFTTVPVGTNGTEIEITDGSSTWSVYNKIGNYWRPCSALRSRSLLKLRFYGDPVHFLKV